MTRIVLVAFVLLAALTGHAQAPERFQNAAPAGNADEGKKLFAGVGCYQCHGLKSGYPGAAAAASTGD